MPSYFKEVIVDFREIGYFCLAYEVGCCFCAEHEEIPTLANMYLSFIPILPYTKSMRLIELAPPSGRHRANMMQKTQLSISPAREYHELRQ